MMIMSRKELVLRRCVLCGEYPAFCYRHVKNDGHYSSLSCSGTKDGVEHKVCLVGKSVDGLIVSWNKLNEKELTEC
jgi:hypothetical protein